MSEIIDIIAREILDSRGNPTVEVDVLLACGSMGRACVPSGASTGSFESVEKRDNNQERYAGKGVTQVVQSINDTIADALIGCDANSQGEIDKFLNEMDGTHNKSNLGANAILGISLAVAKAAASHLSLNLYQYLGGINGCTLPLPLFNILNGGAHADNKLDIQELMIVPVGAPSFRDALRMGSEVFHHLKAILKKAGHNTNVGDEGGFAPQISTIDEAIDLTMRAIDKAGYKKEICLALDVAANELYKDGAYVFTGEGKTYSSDELIDRYDYLAKTYPIISIEDGLFEEDWLGWKKLTSLLGNKVQLVGDDIFVTNPNRLEKGIKEKVANCILIKPNQIGTLSETLQTIRLAQNNGYSVILSHRSGETEDTTISDIAVATNAGQIKSGSLCRSERLAKYNQLIRIEESLASNGNFYCLKVKK